MAELSQGDILRIQGYKDHYLVVSKNELIRFLGSHHVCPLTKNTTEGPLHIRVTGVTGTEGIVACEQIRLVDLSVRGYHRVDRLAYRDIMEVSDAIQGMFEND